MIRATLEVFKLVIVICCWLLWLYISFNLAFESKRTDNKPWVIVNISEVGTKEPLNAKKEYEK